MAEPDIDEAGPANDAEPDIDEAGPDNDKVDPDNDEAEPDKDDAESEGQSAGPLDTIPHSDVSRAFHSQYSFGQSLNCSYPKVQYMV